MATERLHTLFDDPFLMPPPYASASSLQLAPLNDQANRHSLPRLPRPLEPTAVPSRDASNQYSIKPPAAKQDRPKSIQDIVNNSPNKRQKRPQPQNVDESKLELPPIETIDSSTIIAPVEPPTQAIPGLQAPTTSFIELLGRSSIWELGTLSEADGNGRAAEPTADKPKERKKRNKWTAQETEDLLRGVAIYGIGSWKKILNHDGFKFDGRTAIDLKDRFRTCRPQDYKTSTDAKGRSESETNPNSPGAPSPSAAAKKARKPAPSHRKSSADLALLGIDKPFTKSSRRERRAFNEEEDANLMRGYQVYGAAWSRMRNDSSLNLSHRRATDLRDRFRNKFPDRYADAGFKPRPKTMEKSYSSSREKLNSLDTEMTESLPDSVEMSASGTLPRTESSTSLGVSNSMDSTLDFPLSPTIPNLILDQPQNSSAEHDFNRLLLDDDIPPFTPVHNTRLPPFAPSKPYENNLPPLALDPSTLTLSSSQSMVNPPLMMPAVQLPPPFSGGGLHSGDSSGKSFIPNMQFQPHRSSGGSMPSSTLPSLPSMVSTEGLAPLSGGLFSMSMPAIVAPAWEEIGANEMFDIDGGLQDGK